MRKKIYYIKICYVLYKCFIKKLIDDKIRNDNGVISYLNYTEIRLLV